MELLKKIIKNTAFIIAAMSASGFYQLYVYYQNFDIGLYSFSSSYEILLYFIPTFIEAPIIGIIKITIVLFSNLCVLCILIILIITFILINKKLSIKYSCNFIKDIWSEPYQLIIIKLEKSKLFYELIKYSYKIISGIYIIFISFFIFVIFSGLMKVLKFNDSESYATNLYYYLIDNYINVNGNYNKYFGILFVLWSIIVFIRVFRYYKFKRKNLDSSILNFVIIYSIVIMFIFSTIKTTQIVADLKSPKGRKPPENVKFLYNDTLRVETDSNNIYIGSTKDYIIIRDFDSCKNKLYNLKDIKYFEITKNKN
jgi:hypothetical protein